MQAVRHAPGNDALRKMLKADQLVTAPFVFNTVMAKLAEWAGFPALYLGGGSIERRTYDKP